MNPQLVKHLEVLLSSFQKTPFEAKVVRPLSGGCINNGFQLSDKNISFFVKTNFADRYPHMFEDEARGLKTLEDTKSLRIPRHIMNGVFNNTSFLVLEFISSARKKSNFYEDFAIQLAALHKNSNNMFGLDHNNYIGSLPQDNTQSHSWNDFFVARRLEPLLRESISQGLAEKNLSAKFDKLFHRLDHLIPQEQPALLHGDLWSGNVMCDETGSVCLIDPAVYFGHREAEIAFTTLFGAFPSDFYDTYNQVFPLEKQWRSRIDLFNLYPLLVHLLLFGSSYYFQVKSGVEKYL